MDIVLVKKTIEAKGTKSYFFKPQEKVDWQAGQYIVIKLNDLERQFTIASSPTEGSLLQITVRIKEGSEFKKLLDELEIGTEIEASGPFGSFVFPYNLSPIAYHLFLAGGIGITPFRSMIKYNIDQEIKNSTAKLSHMFLIYSNSDSEFVFKKELDQWQKENDFIKVYYHNSSISGHIDELVIKKLLDHWNLVIDNFAAWSVGPRLFVNSMEDILEELKVPQDHIKSEKFGGY